MTSVFRQLQTWLLARVMPACIAVLLTSGVGHAAPAPGNLWAWGEADQGELGYVGSLAAGCPYACQRTPTEATPNSGFIEVSGGNYFSMGLKSDGTVWVWGFNADGALALGYADYTVAYAPIQVAGLSGIVHIAAGAKHALALASDGSVWAWGSDIYGETGTASHDNCIDEPCVPSPAKVVGAQGQGTLGGVVAIKAGIFFSVALMSDGTVWAWGSNAYGNLGNGTVTNASTPTQVSGIAGRGKLQKATAIGTGSQSEHVLAVLSNGTVAGWGDNHAEQLGGGCGSPFCSTAYPALIRGVVGARSVATGEAASFIVLTNGTAAALGDNSSGGLGLGMTQNNGCGECVSTPTRIPGLSGVVDMAAGFYGTFTAPMALQSNGVVKVVSHGYFTALPQPTAVSAIGVGGDQMLAVSAEVLPVLPVFNPSALGFPSTPFGHASAPQSFAVFNTGTGPLTLSAVKVTNVDPSHASHSYEFTLAPVAFPLTIQPGSSASFPVTFTPSAGGCAQAFIAFETNAPNTPTSVYAQGCPQ